jgi:hypothetical protein
MKRLLLALVLGVSCTACMRVSTVVTLKQDGSGTIDEEIGVNPQAFAGLAAMAGGRGGESDKGFADVFNEAKARQQAAQMGVRFVSGTPIDTPALKGYHAKYAFDDIKALKLRMQDATSSIEGQGVGVKKDDPFDFDFARGATSSTITIKIPQDAQKSPMSQLGGPTENPEQAKQMLAMMRPMFAGMHIDIALAVDGRIVKTNAPYVDGSKVTLVEVDMDKLLADDAALARLQKATTPAEMKNIPGMKVTTEPTVTIEFRR